MRQVSNRSHFNVNRVTDYSLRDAKMDNPHATSRELRSIVKEVRTEKPYIPLRKRLISA